MADRLPVAAQLTGRFDEALVHAAQVHREQARKETTIPYIGHLLGVASLVIDDGGDEDEAIAALLHDAVEEFDQVVREPRDRAAPGLRWPASEEEEPATP